MRVWIDLANSPHPLLFAPIARELERQGAEVVVSVRDHAQTLELARQRWPDAAVVGAASPAGRLAKPRELAARALALRRWARGRAIDVALSHNSYAQIVAARGAGIRTVTAMDYEHQPANHLAFRLAHTILLPEAVPAETVRRQGARPGKVVRYEGLKEEVYLAEVEPDPQVLGAVGLELGGRELAVARAAPAGAAYHPGENPLFERCLRALSEWGRHLVVVLARHPEQRRALGELGLEGVVVPERAVDARSLLCRADLFLGAGGTMSREAALLGVPAFSLFAGPPAAVDRQLVDRGLLQRIEDPGQLQAPTQASAPAEARLAEIRRTGERIVERFVAASLAQDLRAARAR